MSWKPNLLLRAAARLQAIRDEWAARQADLQDALLFNRKLWSILVTSVSSEGNPLPSEIRQNVTNLGIYVMNQTVATTGEPHPDKLRPLININRELAAGLLSTG